MNLKDELEYVSEDRADLVARLMGAQAFVTFFLTKAIPALVEHSLDFRTLPEWKDQSRLEAARKLRPSYAQGAIMEYFARLEHGLEAAIRRKGMMIVR